MATAPEVIFDIKMTSLGGVKVDGFGSNPPAYFTQILPSKSAFFWDQIPCHKDKGRGGFAWRISKEDFLSSKSFVKTFLPWFFCKNIIIIHGSQALHSLPLSDIVAQYLPLFISLTHFHLSLSLTCSPLSNTHTHSPLSQTLALLSQTHKLTLLSQRHFFREFM